MRVRRGGDHLPVETHLAGIEVKHVENANPELNHVADGINLSGLDAAKARR